MNSLLKQKELPKILVCFFGVLFAGSAVLNDFLQASGLAVFAAGAFAFWLLTSGKRKAAKKARILEKSLPFALLSISSELGYNSDFEKVLENAARQNHGLFSDGLKKALAEVKQSGASVQEALLHFSESYSSTQLKRSISQLIAAFEQGNRKASAENLKKLALELLARQRIESKEFNSKLALFSLIFITISAVIPALFQSFVIVGSAFLDLEFSPLQVLLIGAVAFPVLDAFVILLVLEKTPEFLKGK